MLGKLFSLLGINKKTIFINEGNEGSNIIQTNIENLNLNSTDEFDELLLPKILKSTLSESDKIKFVDIKDNDFLLNRFYFENENNDILNFFNENQNTLTLLNILKNNNKVILLGNPGLGKTVELECFANEIWNDKDNEFVPVFRNLKNFTAVNTIENYINLMFRRFQKVVFILDGIDEITDIQDFTSKLENFIQKLEIEEREFKILLSCRTNVYEKIVKGVYDFKVYYLKDLMYDQSIELLKNKCGDIVDSLNLNELDVSFLKSPFQVNILANYVNDKKKLPTNNAELWKEYIESRFFIDENEKLKKITLDITLINDYCKKISLINELMQTNIFGEDDLFKIVKKDSHDFKEFQKNPLIEFQLQTKRWNFEHRNIQEYFASLLISDLEFEDIKKFIFITGTNKTHPLLFNTITFLLNILDHSTSKFKQLIDFLVDNEPELLFRAENDRITEAIRERVFQKYFEDTCIEKTYWIGTDRTFSIEEIARFGDCQINFDYLSNIIKDEERHFRARISALNLISFFGKISTTKQTWFKAFLIEYLSDNNNSKQIKSSMLHCISRMNICNNDEDYLRKILHVFKDETSKQINVEILNIINEFDYIDLYYDFINEEFLRENNIKPRLEKDDVSRGNSYVLNQLILKIRDSDKFMNFAQYYFDSNNNIDIYSTDEDELIQKCVEFDSNDDQFIIKMFKKLDIQKTHFYFERPISELISKISRKSINGIFEYLIKSYDFKDVNYVLSILVNDENIWYVIEKFKTTIDVEYKEIEYFRNATANANKRDLAKFFNDEMIKIGFSFNEEMYSDEKILKIQEDFEKKPQMNLDILFKRDELLDEIKQVFNENGKEISKERFSEIHFKWYQKNGHANKIDKSLKILSRLIYQIKRPALFADVEKLIKDDNFIFNEIKNEIKSNEKVTDKVKISEFQKKDIGDWVKQKTIEINFNEIFAVNSYGFSQLGDYNKWDDVVYFSRKLDLVLPQDFLLNSLIIPEISSYNEDKSWFDFFKEKIIDKNTFDERIKENIKTLNLTTYVLEKHINYAIENLLKEVFPEIREYLLNHKREYNFKKQLFNFYKLENDVKLLKECCIDLYSFKAWESISILLEEGLDNDFCENKALEYLENIDDDFNKSFISDSLNVLFKVKSERAIEFYYRFLGTDLYASAHSNYFADYDVVKDYNMIESFFNKIYLDKKFDKTFNNSASFLDQYVSNLSKVETSYLQVQKVLLGIKDKLKARDEDTGIFHINLLIDNSNNSYINSKSKPLPFIEAMKKVESILY
ncbi:hypothetical protein NYQ10_19930 [Flavobacterium johnsoniae]|uniref:NACHT domain-containing protein n=1 Tax=Flavobacterium johnsoniae TaxID=986 RepID=UPI0025AFB325|nr:hypothetical protein [Flavobacterium johnsoniae]WJS94356.1 hypothetical protein NYQ10_19930 [Flavobacterium johnsoniae]